MRLFAVRLGMVVRARAPVAPRRHGGEVAPTAATITSRAHAIANAPTAAYLTDAALNGVDNRSWSNRARGASGKLRVTIQPAPAPIAPTRYRPARSVRIRAGRRSRRRAPRGAGIWNVLLAIGNAVRPVPNFNVITMLPFSAKQNGRSRVCTTSAIGRRSTAGSGRQGAAGRVRRIRRASSRSRTQNADTPVSEHFKLRDFLTHDQPNVWPKYLVLQPKLVDKLELVLSDLQAHGVDVHGVHVMSGFRSPQYNYTGGNTGGRADLSRHMYGDASDIYIDNDGDGQMDDLNHDGRSPSTTRG